MFEHPSFPLHHSRSEDEMAKTKAISQVSTSYLDSIIHKQCRSTYSSSTNIISKGHVQHTRDDTNANLKLKCCIRFLVWHQRQQVLISV